MTDKQKAAFLLGAADYQRGLRTNPFPYGRRQRAWTKGFNAAAEAALQAHHAEQTTRKPS